MDLNINTALCAARWLGTKEGSPEHQQILKIYNGIRPLPRGYAVTQKDAWCAAFASAAAVMAGAGERYPLECSCSRMIEGAKAMGIWVEDDGYVPRIGDWVLYNWQAAPAGVNNYISSFRGDDFLCCSLFGGLFCHHNRLVA